MTNNIFIKALEDKIKHKIGDKVWTLKKPFVARIICPECKGKKQFNFNGKIYLCSECKGGGGITITKPSGVKEVEIKDIYISGYHYISEGDNLEDLNVTYEYESGSPIMDKIFPTKEEAEKHYKKGT